MKIDWNKLLSGRFIFTVFAAFVFVNAAIDKTLSPSQTEAILMLIIGFYFNRIDREKTNGEEKK